MEVNKERVLKLLQLILAVICLLLWIIVGSYSSYHLLVCGTIFGYTIISVILFFGCTVNASIDKNLDAAFSIVGCIFFLISGALTIVSWNDANQTLYGDRKTSGMIAGILMVVNGILFLISAIFILKQ